MARRFERITHVDTTNLATVDFTVPANHKYEVAGISLASSATIASTWYLALFDGTATWFLDQINMPVGLAGVYREYSGLVFYAGEILYVIPTAASAIGNNHVTQYIDVSF